MTPEAFLVLVASCGLNLPPGVTPDRLLTYADVESGRNPSSISAPNRNGTRDHGLMQINPMHFARFGVNERTVMEPCTNLRIGATIIAENDARSACLYNTGKPYCTNGYDIRIMRAAARLANAPALPTNAPAPAAAAPPVAARPAARRPACDLPEWDVWATCPRPTPAAPPPADVEAAPSEPVVLRSLAMGSP